MGELEQELRLLVVIAENGRATTQALCEAFHMSNTTFSRRIKDLRHLGVEITPVKGPGKVSEWSWEVKNWDKVKVMTFKWLEIERARPRLSLKDEVEVGRGDR